MSHEPGLAVVGLGYVGLPLALEASRSGMHVTGLDVAEEVVTALNAGRSHVDDISDGEVAAEVARGFVATTHAEDLRGAGTYLICVPTPLSGDGGPDLTAVRAAAQAIASVLGPGDLVVLESTTYPGTTEEFVGPLLETSGLQAGRDFHLAFSPERIDPGNPTYGVRNTPKVVGGIDEPSTRAAAEFYARICDTVVCAKGTREAELAKLLENTYRHVNIALVNEMAQFSKLMDIDLWNAIECAKTKPFGFQAFYPGPGVGGHCIPIDPNYLSHRVRTQLGQSFRFVELAQEVNAGMPNYVARRVQDLLNDHGQAVRGSSVLLLGVTYKADIADQRESPSRPLAQQLREMGADVAYWDPHVDSWDADGPVRRVSDLARFAPESDCIVLLQAHRELDLDVLRGLGDRVLDTRGHVPGANWL